MQYLEAILKEYEFDHKAMLISNDTFIDGKLRLITETHFDSLYVTKMSGSTPSYVDIGNNSRQHGKDYHNNNSLGRRAFLASLYNGVDILNICYDGSMINNRKEVGSSTLLLKIKQKENIMGKRKKRITWLINLIICLVLVLLFNVIKYQIEHFDYDENLLSIEEKEKYDEFYKGGNIAYGQYIDVKLIDLSVHIYDDQLMSDSEEPVCFSNIMKDGVSFEKNYCYTDIYKKGDRVLVAEFQYIYKNNSKQKAYSISTDYDTYPLEREKDIEIDNQIAENYKDNEEWSAIRGDLNKYDFGYNAIKSMNDVKVKTIKIPIICNKNEETIRAFMNERTISFVGYGIGEYFQYNFEKGYIIVENSY